MKFTAHCVLFAFNQKDSFFRPVREMSSENECHADTRVLLPDNITVEDYITSYRKLTFMKRYGFNFGRNHSEKAIERLLTIDSFQLCIACRLLSKTPHRAFVKSIKRQVVEWLYNDTRRHYPLTVKQEKCFEETEIYTVYKSRRQVLQSDFSVCTNFS